MARYLLLVMLAALLACILAVTGGDAALGADLNQTCSQYCRDIGAAPAKTKDKMPNSIMLLTGPGRGRENRLIIGYMRRLKPDLSLGFQVQGTDKGGYEGFALGLTYHFSDPE